MTLKTFTTLIEGIQRQSGERMTGTATGNTSRRGNTWLLVGAGAVVAAGMLSAFAGVQRQAEGKIWSVVTFRESFGVIDALRIESGGRIDFCRTDMNKILQQYSAEAPSGNIVGFFSDLEVEIKRLSVEGWGSPNPAIDQASLMGPSDGPHWTIRHIYLGPNNAEVRNLEGLGEVGSLVNLILDAVSQNNVDGDQRGGVLVIGPYIEQEWPTDNAVTTHNSLALQLLANAGRCLGEPYPQQLEKLVLNGDGVAEIEAADLRFVLRQLQP